MGEALTEYCAASGRRVYIGKAYTVSFSLGSADSEVKPSFTVKQLVWTDKGPAVAVVVYTHKDPVSSFPKSGQLPLMNC